MVHREIELVLVFCLAQDGVYLCVHGDENLGSIKQGIH